jgi:hypothetical protein
MSLIIESQLPQAGTFEKFLFFVLTDQI